MQADAGKDIFFSTHFSLKFSERTVLSLTRINKSISEMPGWIHDLSNKWRQY